MKQLQLCFHHGRGGEQFVRVIVVEFALLEGHFWVSVQVFCKCRSAVLTTLHLIFCREDGHEGSEEATDGQEDDRPPPANLFLKRSVDQDFVNNNNDQEEPEPEEEDMETDETPPSKPGGENPPGSSEESEGKDPSTSDTSNPGSASKMFPASLLNMNSPPPGSAAPTPGGAGGMPSAAAITEQMKNISMTISQLTQTLANSSSQPKSVQELTMLQATLFGLQQQQLLHMQILAQMQQSQEEAGAGGKGTPGKEPSPVPSIAELAKKMELQNTLGSLVGSSVHEPPAKPIIPGGAGSLAGSLAALMEKEANASKSGDGKVESTPVPPSLPPTSVALGAKTPTLAGGSDLKPIGSSTPVSTSGPGAPTGGSSGGDLPLSAQILDPNAPSSLASSIIMPNDNEPMEKPVNSLELLQKKAQGILNNASQGLLANNLADFSVSKEPGFDKKGEPFFKHR